MCAGLYGHPVCFRTMVYNILFQSKVCNFAKKVEKNWIKGALKNFIFKLKFNMQKSLRTTDLHYIVKLDFIDPKY